MGATARSVCWFNLYDFSETRKTRPVKRDSEFLVAGDLNRIGMGDEKIRAVRRTVEGSPTTHAGTEGQAKSFRTQDPSGSGCECYPSYVDSGHSKWPDLGRISVGRVR